ncbi:DUF2141 domain-containing protein [Luteimonas composti]|uniref:DUF2141 domain-containing protein n=1 Tax=Luteimonas composti TaxID=398257 RepID=A0ABT6MV40_9GAMM|nr:DUF2141 domain-containing protein [Luteimonas composti]MDH7454467.1 DUF2141 domain-containing protein [Luteimonas composti]
MDPSRRRRPLLLLPLLASALVLPAFAVELVVDIERVGAQTGRLTVFVYDSEEAWNSQRDALRMQRAYPDGSDRLQVRFDGLKAGRYGVMVLHDKDGNRKFDIGPLGIPRDDYGFSNNPVLFARPGFDRIAFALPAQGGRITVRMK